MSESLTSRIKNAWNAFNNRDPITESYTPEYGSYISYRRPDRFRYTRGNERSIISSIYNRISIDVSSLTYNHVQLDSDGRYSETLETPLNECLTLNANLDQSGRMFLQDVVMSLLDEGCIAIVPVVTDRDPRDGRFDIYELRTGKILDWYPDRVKVRAYNENTGQYQEIFCDKKDTAIVENPFYSVMNEPNSTLQRLIRKLNLLDVIDEQSGSNKLDLIIQLPYVVKTPTRQKQAKNRMRSIEEQLENSKYGIAYTDGTEKITQLNRSVENNLLSQIEYLTKDLYGQLGISAEVMSGTADEKTMLNYNNRTIEPIASAIVDEMKRKFLTRTARSQGKSVMFFRDPFRLVPVEQMSEIADKFTRNEIMSSNEIRQTIGLKPADDPKADELRNANISESKEEIQARLGENNNPEESFVNMKVSDLIKEGYDG